MLYDNHLYATLVGVCTLFFTIIIIPLLKPSIYSDNKYVVDFKTMLFGPSPASIDILLFGRRKKRNSLEFKRADSSDELHTSLKVELIVICITLGIEIMDFIAKLNVFMVILGDDAVTSDFVGGYSVFVVCLCGTMFLTVSNRWGLLKAIRADIKHGCKVGISPSSGFLTCTDVEVRAARLARENFSHRQSLALMVIQEITAIPITLWFMAVNNNSCVTFSNFKFVSCFGSVCICFSLIGE